VTQSDKDAGVDADIVEITNGIKGMMQVEGKTIVQNLLSEKSWADLSVPEDIIRGLRLLEYTKPSLIQSRAIPLIASEPTTNFVF